MVWRDLLCSAIPIRRRYQMKPSLVSDKTNGLDSYTQTIPNETLMYFMQGAGLVGTFYLCFYAVLGMSMLLTPIFQSKAIAIVLSIGLLLFMSPVMALIGFLYISTNLHEKFMKGGMNDAA